jgi:hypothetical protein
LLSRKRPDCVTHVPGMNCHPSLRKGNRLDRVSPGDSVPKNGSGQHLGQQYADFDGRGAALVVMSTSSFRQRVRQWREGEYPPHDPNSSLVILPGSPRRHRTSRVCHAAVEYAREHHQWLIGAAIAAAGVPNAFAERLIGSIRRECPDHLVVLGEAHLRRILGEYAAYCNTSRNHRSLDKDAPVSKHCLFR